MGFFKSIRELQKQANEIENEMPPVKDRMAGAMSQMQNAQAMLAHQTEAANAAAMAMTSGVSATVTIAAARQVGQMNFQPLIEFDLTVLPEGRPPYPAKVTQVVNPMQVAQMGAGATLQAKVDPSNPSAVWLDLTTLH